MRPGAPDPGIVVFAGLDWWYHNRAHSDFQLATRLSTRRRVLLVNSIGTRLPQPGRTSGIGRRLRNKLRSVLRGVRRPDPERLPEFWVYSPLVVPAYGSALGRRLATALVRAQVAVVRRWLRITEPALLVTPPTAWPVVRDLRRGALVYNRSDKHSAFAEVDTAAIAALESELLRAADHVLYVSHELRDEDAPLVGERAVFLDHGVDADLFRPDVAEAAALAGVPRPRVGYFGTFRDHTVDGALLLHLARSLPEVAFVLVGPSSMDLDALTALPNVHRFGQQEHRDVPAFGVGFDVGIMPWLDNDWIRKCNPIKLKEYLALGLPTVTTDFPEAHRYAGLVRTVRGAEEFVAAVREELADRGDPAARRAAVAGETWDARAETVLRLLGATVPGR
ncbi:MAG TPA: glycosyltransferase [Pseudonocardiaceae bacterium]